jgi:hypothetical protein
MRPVSGVLYSGYDPAMKVALRNRLWYSVLFALSAFFIFLEPAARSIAQLFMVPLLCAVVWRTSVQGVRVPRVIFALVLLGVSAGAILRFSTVHLRDGAFVVATVSKQGLWQETKIYRDRLHRALGSDGLALAGLHRGSISSQSAAESVLASRNTIGGVVWGAPRWMSITFRPLPALSLGGFSAGSFAKRWLERNHWKDLRVLRSVPAVGLSHGHQDATVHFIASMILLWNDFGRYTEQGREGPQFESRLVGVARTQARWSSRSHIGLVLWMLGTYHLVRAVEGESIERGELACALREFADALTQFRQRDNPALYAAIQNNFGIAMLLEGELLDQRSVTRNQAVKRVTIAERSAAIGGNSNKDIGLNLMSLGVVQGRKNRGSRK